MITFFVIKALFILAIFSKAWLDVKGNKNQLDHIITGLFEASLVIVAFLLIYFEYWSLINTGAFGLVGSYLCLRFWLFDLFRNKIAKQPDNHFGTNNWLDLQKKKLYDWGMKKRFPVLSISQFFIGVIGLII